jgi:RpiR family carbohydrate utilization transcriptional regulator
MDRGPVSFLALLRSSVDGLTPALARVGRHILAQPEEVVHQTITELAEASGASEASIMRFCRTMGFEGFPRMRMAIATDPSQRAESAAGAGPSGGPRDVVERMAAHATAALAETAHLLDAAALDEAAVRLGGARRVEIYAVGNSAVVAQHMAIKLLRLGLPVAAPSDPHVGVMGASLLGPGDVAVGISSSGSTLDVLRAVEAAQRGGAAIIGVTNQTRCPLARIAGTMLVASAPESPLTGGALTSKIGQMLIVDALAALIALRFPERLGMLERTAEAILDRRV